MAAEDAQTSRQDKPKLFMPKVGSSEKTLFWEIRETRDHPLPGSGKSGVRSPAREANSRRVCLYLGHNSATANGFIWSDAGPMQQQLQLPPDT
ncbi:GD21699 [Drosophila simulans]|uniref:GD21699 n=1 Tax=Drosophila simulans TaxID=7240 RepID=B4Q3D8_DROSI|nr:GD21699 [Drosophila simulans]